MEDGLIWPKEVGHTTGAQAARGKRRASIIKAREPRKKALLVARVRSGTTWRDVSLLNLSSRGALVQSANPPPQGAYIEVRRGSHDIVARVMWTDKHRFGIHSQDAIAVDEIISERDSAKAHQPDNPKRDLSSEGRRSANEQQPSDMNKAAFWQGLRSFSAYPQRPSSSQAGPLV